MTLAAWRASPSLRGFSISSADIPRLSEAEARGLVEGLRAGRPLDERVVGQILRSARGLPGPLREATLAALNSQALGRPRAALRPRKGAGRVAAAVVVLVLLAAGAWWYLGHDMSRVVMPGKAPSPQSVEPPAPEERPSGDSMTEDTTAAASPARSSGEAPRASLTRPTPPATTGAQVERPAVPAPRPVAEGPGGPVQVRKPRPSSPAKPSQAKVKAVRTKDVVAAQVGVPVAKAATDQGRGGRDGRSWLSRQPATAFTIQLVTFKTAKEAMRYIRKKGIAGQAATIETRHRGRPLYLVVYGSYPDRKAAQEAASRLPKALRRYKPWIRGISSLRRIARRSGGAADS